MSMKPMTVGDRLEDVGRGVPVFPSMPTTRSTGGNPPVAMSASTVVWSAPTTAPMVSPVGVGMRGNERNRRSAERKVAGWFDATDESSGLSFQSGPYPVPKTQERRLLFTFGK